MSHSAIEPAILYWGTPVVLVTTTNEDGTPNIGVMSSAFWLGNRCMLGLASSSQTTINLRRTKQCVLNLPSDNMIAQVNAISRTTGSPIVPDFKVNLGYQHVKDKFTISRLTPEKSETVGPPRIKECPVQMEAAMVGEHKMMGDLPGELQGFALAIEVMVLKTYVIDAIRKDGHANRIDPDKWRPMIMSFQHLYGLRNVEQKSTLSNIEEELYRLPSSSTPP
ncbi:MAG: hypothetical protein M1822_004735 [Bathelium mastoideum]|nr:MAG: hypothetical protein M1822_004735 [Bathelium mastoideum]